MFSIDYKCYSTKSDAENSAWPGTNCYIKIEITIFKIDVFHNISFYCIFDKIKTVLLRIRDVLKTY